MSNSIVDLTVSVVDDQTVSIDPYAGNSVDVAFRDGHFYSGLAPGASYLLVPSYLVVRPALDRVITPDREQWVQAKLRSRTDGSDWGPSRDRMRIVLASLAGCCLGASLISGWLAGILFLLFRHWYPTASDTKLVALAAGTILCTLVFVYAASIEHRVMASALLLTALWLAERHRRSTALGLLFGLLLGLSILTSFESAFLVPLLALWWLRRRDERHLRAVTLGACVPVALLLLYANRCFGAPWATPYAYRLKFAIFHTQGWNSAFPLSIHEALLEAPRFAVEFLVGRELGLFIYSPLLLLNLCLFVPNWRQGLHRDLTRFAVSASTVVLAFHLVTGYRLGTGDFGPRYLIMAIPFLMLLAPAVRVPPVVFWLLWGLGAVVAMRGVMYGLLHEPFWPGYAELLRKHGLTSYALLKWKAIGGGLGPIASSVAVTLILCSALYLLFGPFRSPSVVSRKAMTNHNGAG